MAATFLTPAKLALTTSAADLQPGALAAATPSLKVRRWDIRVANIGAADATVDLTITDGTTTITRCKNYPVPYNTSGSAPDLELALMLPATWKIQGKASANSVLEMSGLAAEDDA